MTTKHAFNMAAAREAAVGEFGPALGAFLGAGLAGGYGVNPLAGAAAGYGIGAIPEIAHALHNRSVKVASVTWSAFFDELEKIADMGNARRILATPPNPAVRAQVQSWPTPIPRAMSAGGTMGSFPGGTLPSVRPAAPAPAAAPVQAPARTPAPAPNMRPEVTPSRPSAGLGRLGDEAGAQVSGDLSRSSLVRSGRFSVPSKAAPVPGAATPVKPPVPTAPAAVKATSGIGGALKSVGKGLLRAVR